MSITAEQIPGYATGTWTLDPAHSEISFTVRHLAISKVRGTFDSFTATVVTGENPEDTTLVASIEVASINTNQKDRDNHLRTNDFFAAEEFPTIEFTSTGVSHNGDNFVLDGNLTLRGVTKPISIVGEFGGVITDSYGQTKAGASGTTKINRKDFGVSWNTMVEGTGFMLGDEITISIEAQVVLQK